MVNISTWQMGHNEWIKYGWGPKLSTTWYKNASLVYDFRNDNQPIELIDGLTAALQAIDEIVATYPKPYLLMCSGGVDSQAMLWAWKQSGHPFEVQSIKYISNGVWFNKHDLLSLEKFSAEHDIQVNYETFDILDFLESSRLGEIARANDCHSPQICTHIAMSELIKDGTIIFSGNWLAYRMPVAKQVFSNLNYTVLGLHRYALSQQSTNRKIIPYFFNFTPELAYMEFKTNSELDKITVLLDNNFVVVKPESTYTGFEKVKEYYDDNKFKHRIEMREKVRCGYKASTRTFDYLFRYKLEDHRNVDYIVPSTVLVNTTYLKNRYK